MAARKKKAKRRPTRRARTAGPAPVRLHRTTFNLRTEDLVRIKSIAARLTAIEERNVTNTEVVRTALETLERELGIA